MESYQRSMWSTFRSFLLCALASSVVVCATLGIIGILTGEWGLWNINLTSAVISIASISGLACAASMNNGAKVLPGIGILLTVGTALMFISMIWLGTSGDLFFRVLVSCCVLAFAFAHASLLSTARLARHFQWSQLLAKVVIFGIAGLMVLLFWIGDIQDFNVFYVIMVASIISAAVSVLIPIFHVMSKGDVTVPERRSTSPIVRKLQIDKEIETLKHRIANLELERKHLEGFLSS